MIFRFFLISFFFLLSFNSYAFDHPHLLVDDADKLPILTKIETEPWAKKIFSEMRQRLYPYVAQYRMTTEYDPTWLTSRYLMNREKGRRYTSLKVKPNGLEVDSVFGDAPVPTIRYSIGNVRPETKEIFPLRPPSIEELVPYNKNSEIPFFNQLTHRYENVEASRYCELINGEINQIALESAIMYWLTGEREYGRLAADVLQQWAKAAYYQQAVRGSRQAGLFSGNVLGDTEYQSLILVYDFLAGFLKDYGYDMTIYQSVFEKICWTLISQGSLENYAAKNPMLVSAALSVDNELKREKLLGYIIDKDSIVARDYGNLCLNTAIPRFFSSNGFYKDPGKHASAVYNILLSSWMLEHSGIPITNEFPLLLKAGDVRLLSAFPDLSLSSFGDVSNVYSDGNLLEMSLSLSLLKKSADSEEKSALLDFLVQKGRHDRTDSGWLGLLIYSSQSSKIELPNEFWARSGNIDYAQFYFQRNGMDQNSGLMFNVQGATYSGNHANGMSAEFYGAGRVLGIDPGIGRNLADSLHIQYYSQWAAHNTVVSAGSSSPERIYKGGSTSKAMGQIDLVSMEPMSNQDAVSPSHSFINTHYLENFTKTNQDRLLSIVRTSPVSGFYVDIYRSNNRLWNNYLYHNVGDKLEILDQDRRPLQLHAQKIPLVEPDFPGLRFIRNTKSTGEYRNGVTAQFSFKNSKNEHCFMQALIPGMKGRTYFAGTTPKAESATAPYDSLPVPTLVMHQMGDAWKEPFVVVYEPYIGRENFSVQSVEWLNRNYKGEQTALKVNCKDDLTYWIISSVNVSYRGTLPQGLFIGNYAAIEYRKNNLQSIYLGKGLQLDLKEFSLKAETSDCSANIVFGDNYLDVTTTQPLLINWKLVAARKAYLVEKGSEEQIPLIKQRKGGFYQIPVLKEGRVYFEK